MTSQLWKRIIRKNKLYRSQPSQCLKRTQSENDQTIGEEISSSEKFHWRKPQSLESIIRVGLKDNAWCHHVKFFNPKRKKLPWMQKWDILNYLASPVKIRKILSCVVAWEISSRPPLEACQKEALVASPFHP